MIMNSLFVLLLSVNLICSSPTFEIHVDFEESLPGLTDKEFSKLVLQNFQEWRQIGINDDDSLPTLDMIRKYGYKAESHKVLTGDGYINTLHRIPPKGAQESSRVVFLQHGLLGTSADFVMGTPQKSLGYILADIGCDVWLGNARGNEYSREHVNLTISDALYWAFSFDEMGKFDIPAALDYILNVTKAERISYIGHSMGTVMFWVAMNQETERVSQQADLMIAMGPVAKVSNMKSPIRFLAPFIKEIEYIFWLMGVNEFVPSNRLIQLFDKYACDATMRQLELCENICFLLVGFDAPQTNMTLLPIILGHEPGGTSTRTVLHFAQEVNSRKFSHYDYGSAAANILAYNSSTPPEYDLAKVTVPVALFWSDNDWLADPKDVKYLTSNLPNIVLNERIPLPKFNHIDFLWAIDADVLVYKKIVSLLSGQFF